MFVMFKVFSCTDRSTFAMLLVILFLADSSLQILLELVFRPSDSAALSLSVALVA